MDEFFRHLTRVLMTFVYRNLRGLPRIHRWPQGAGRCGAARSVQMPQELVQAGAAAWGARRLVALLPGAQQGDRLRERRRWGRRRTRKDRSGNAGLQGESQQGKRRPRGDQSRGDREGTRKEMKAGRRKEMGALNVPIGWIEG